MSPRTPLSADSLRGLLLAPAGPLSRLEVVPTTGSTNADVAAALRADPGSWPSGSLLVAEHQSAGRGRLDRSWTAPGGTALTCSFVVRLDVPEASLGWLPLLAGLAAVTAVRATAGVHAVLKWPNDVLIHDETWSALPGWGHSRKVGGVLCERVALPGVDTVVVGFGLNVHQRADELPVESATSLLLAGAHHVDRETLLVALVTAAHDVAHRWREAAVDAHAAGLADEVAEVCATLGRPVRADLPDGTGLVGIAQQLDGRGALLVRTQDGTERAVVAGDVVHLRPDETGR